MKIKTYKIGVWEFTANTKKEAVKKYFIQHFETYMCKCDRSFNTIYKKAKEVWHK